MERIGNSTRPSRMTNEELAKDSSIDVESVKSNAASTSNGSLTCTATLKPPLCRIGNNNSDVTGGNDPTTITYEEKQPAWECSFSRDGTYLAVCYGAPNPCLRIYHYGIDVTATSSDTNPPKHECDTDHRSDTTTWQNNNKAQSQNMNRATPFATKYSWQLQSTLDGVQSRTIRSVHFAPISRPLVIASASFDGTIAIWEQQLTCAKSTSSTTDAVVDWECTTELQGHENEVKCVRWNATGSLLATCGRDKTIWIWEAYLPGTIGGGPVISTMGHKQLEAPTVTTSSFECISVLNGHEGDVKHIQFACSHDQFGDGSEILLSASYDDTIRIWAEEDGDWYCALSISSVHTSTIWTLTIAPSATRFVSGSADQSLAIYKCFTPEELRLRDTESGQQLETSRKKATWECVGKLPNAHSSTIYCVDYAPARASHGRIVSCGADNRIQIYREVSTSTPEQPLFVVDTSVTVLTGGDINCVRWHPYDGSVLASTSDDGSVRIWNYTI